MADENGNNGSESSRRGERALAPDGGDVVGNHGVDEELSTRLEGSDGTTIEPAATEKSVETTDGGMDIGQNGPDDEDREQTDRSETDEGIDLESALSDALDDNDEDEDGDVLQQTASSTDHAVGEGDPDDLFDEFDEDSPEEVIEAADESAESEADVDVSGLFEDLGEVEESTVSAPATDTESSASAAAADTEPATAGPGESNDGGLLGETDETAGEIEGLLDDLGSVDVEETDTSTTGTAHTEPTILSTEETAATGFQWLGEDIRIFPSGGDPDAVFDEFDEESPEEVIQAATRSAVTATALFDDLADGQVTYPDVEARTDGWSAGDTTRAGIEATALFDRMTEAVTPPRSPSTEAESAVDDADDSGVTTFGRDAGGAETTDNAGPESVGADTGATETTDSVADTGAAEADDGLDLEFDLNSDTDQDTEFADAGTETAEADDGLDLEFDLETGTDTDGVESVGDAGAVDIDLDSIDEAESDAGTGTESADAGVVDAETPVEETGSELNFDLDIEESVEAGANGASADPASEPTPEPEPDPETETEAPDGAVAAESDVDAVFERFDEGSPEELIAAAETESEPSPVEGIEPSEEHIDDLFGDLSAVSLTPVEREEPREETGEALEPGSEETVAAIEGLLGDMSPADVPETMSEDDTDDPAAPVDGEEPTFTAEAGGESDLGDEDTDDPDVLEQTSEDTHVAVGESDIDAFFERFNESSPEEIAESARVPPLEELGERDPERVREEIGDDHTERTSEVGDDDPIEVLGPDDGDDESLSGAIRDDLGANEGTTDDRTSGRRQRDGDGHDTGDGLSDLDPDDIFGDASGRDDDRGAVPETGSDADPDPESSGVTMNGEDLVSDARGAEAESTGRTNSERVGEALTDADADTATDTADTEPESDPDPQASSGSEQAPESATESETAEDAGDDGGIVTRVLSRLRGLF